VPFGRTTARASIKTEPDNPAKPIPSADGRVLVQPAPFDQTLQLRASPLGLRCLSKRAAPKGDTTMTRIVGFAIAAVLLSAVVVFVYMLIDLIRERAVDEAAWRGAGTWRPDEDDHPARPE
jgi:hypothetical protein